MRVALCISGCLDKNWVKVAKSICNFILKKYKCHLYLVLCSKNDKLLCIKDKFINKTDIISLYQPWTPFIKLLPISQGMSREGFNDKIPDNCIHMFHKLYECDQLRQQQNIEYDIVVRLRPDIVIKPKFTLINNPSLKQSLICQINMSNMIWDQIFYASPEIMTFICNIYKNPPKDQSCNNAHYLLTSYIDQHNINLFHTDMHCHHKKAIHLKEYCILFNKYTYNIIYYFTLLIIIYIVNLIN
jgi:hypothetical protein